MNAATPGTNAAAVGNNEAAPGSYRARHGSFAASGGSNRAVYRRNKATPRRTAARHKRSIASPENIFHPPRDSAYGLCEHAARCPESGHAASRNQTWEKCVKKSALTLALSPRRGNATLSLLMRWIILRVRDASVCATNTTNQRLQTWRNAHEFSATDNALPLLGAAGEASVKMKLLSGRGEGELHLKLTQPSPAVPSASRDGLVSGARLV